MKPSIALIDSIWQSLEPGSPLLSALKSLPPDAQRAVYLRFWENCLIEEIAASLAITWEAADHLLEESIFFIREFLCLIVELTETQQAV